MDSTPQPIKISPSPAMIALAAWFIASSPDEQFLLTVTPGTVAGSPARSVAILATLRLSSPA